MTQPASARLSRRHCLGVLIVGLTAPAARAGRPQPAQPRGEGFGAFLKAETQRYAQVIKASGLSLDAPG